jgi:hypothetical protein
MFGEENILGLNSYRIKVISDCANGINKAATRMEMGLSLHNDNVITKEQINNLMFGQKKEILELLERIEEMTNKEQE